MAIGSSDIQTKLSEIKDGKEIQSKQIVGLIEEAALRGNFGDLKNWMDSADSNTPIEITTPLFEARYSNLAIMLLNYSRIKNITLNFDKRVFIGLVVRTVKEESAGFLAKLLQENENLDYIKEALFEVLLFRSIIVSIIQKI